ncbi:MAG: hypothetical protein KAR05_06885 [Candidatus Omnitrophica bacterium]|nr:hypothetical protein [Candidatus Omnitrophota bacterium]
MTPKRADYQHRRDIILGVVVNQYIKNVSPVSSSCIAQEYLVDLSPATIRNILAELEHEGFLTHPHTSAGRVPTQDGYRYYVDYLMSEIQLLEEEKRCINTSYAQDIIDLENILEKTSEVLADLTHYTSIISVDGWEDRVFCRGTNYVVNYADMQDLDRMREILYALEKKERLLDIINQKLESKIKIYIGHEIASTNIEGCSLAVAKYKIHNGPSGRLAVLGPTRMDYQKVVSALEYFSSLINDLV